MGVMWSSRHICKILQTVCHFNLQQQQNKLNHHNNHIKTLVMLCSYTFSVLHVSYMIKTP